MISPPLHHAAHVLPKSTLDDRKNHARRDPQPPAIFLVGANRFKLTIYTSGYGGCLCKRIGQDAEREGIERVQVAALLPNPSADV
jgi:hypothetical protein